MTRHGDARRDAIELLEQANPIDVSHVATEGDLVAARERVRRMIAAREPTGAPIATRHRRHRVGPGLGAAAAVTAVVAAVLFLGSGTTPEVPTAAAMTIQRAAEAVQPTPGSILHIDYTLTSSYPNGDRWSTRQDVWQQQRGALCNWLNLQLGTPGTPSGTEGGSVDGRQELYDPIRNTIYVAPPITSHLPSSPAGKAPPSECSFMAQFAQQVRAVLRSGRARVEGRARIDDKDTIKIVSGANTYYVAADGSYAPVELINGTPTDENGMTTMVFHAYEHLPPAAANKLLSLTAKHPTAAVDSSLPAFRAANNRLFPNG